MRTISLILIGSILFIYSYGQKDYKGLLQSAITPGIVMYEMPLKTIFLSTDDYWSYTGYIEELKEHVDSAVIFEIISNSKRLDSSKWSFHELPNVILIANEGDQISKKKIKTILKNVPRSPISDLKNFNNIPVEKRNILAHSRPVFDNSGKYAVVAYKERRGYGTILYHWVDSHWVELGVLVRWVV